MANTRMQKKNVSSDADVVPEEAPMEPRNSPNSDVPIPQKSGGGEDVNAQANGGGEDVNGQANGYEKNGDKSRKTKRLKVLFSSPKKGDENAKKGNTWLLSDSEESDEAGTPEEQEMFLREVKTLYKENSLEFKTLKFYGQPLNLLKLWRAVVKIGGYDVVTNCSLWRQIGTLFNPPKTCTTLSYTFRIFYEKSLLEYEKYLRKNGELDLPGSPAMLSPKIEKKASGHQGSKSGRVRRESAVRAMEGWHALHLAGPEENETLTSTPKLKKLKSIGLQKNIPQHSVDLPVSPEAGKQLVAEIVDVGPIADWVKINVHETKDSFEVYALVPGLLRDEVRVQSDPAGRVLITGQPEELDNPWGITPFEKIVALSARIDAPRTSAVLTSHGRLFIQVPFEQ